MRFFISLFLVSLLFCGFGCVPASQEPPTQSGETPLSPALRADADHLLSEMLHSDDPMLRVHALEGIQDTNGVQHKDEILHALEDHEARVRFAAALAAGELEIHEAQWPLLNIAEDKSENVRVAVRFALHRLGYKQLSHELERLATDANPLVRGNTAFVLGMMGEPSALKILHIMENDPEAPVRQNAAEAMWRLGDEEGLQELVGLTQSGHPDDQMFAYLALAQPKNSRVRQQVRIGLKGVADEKDPNLGPAMQKYGPKWGLAVPLVAARAMGLLGSDEGVIIAINGVRNDDPQLRILGALALGAIGRSDTQHYLEPMLKDKDANVRIAAATAILQLKSPG